MSAEHDTLLQHDQDFFDALVAGDAARLADLLTDDFLLVGVEDGVVAGKDVLLELVGSGALRFPGIDAFPGEAVVRFFGDAGVVVGRTAMRFTQDGGPGFGAGSRYTHVYAADGRGGWRLASAQGTAIKP
ncbi:nuclear transport factor 2 family protein [Actinomadura sp. ATCC 31491]|uniref:Nuclear transport factor 2 family protein n=1 Tax=Actinomadura luzonensis TaxID=2805427 RepID=A0ABT0G1X7_9ACTN|nr:nuclear transport factor 2 family protein [Actinomadura luzonensis]MCK2218606.1 nuclear transport factor 2 family protein [Actinomadura luzonensis]